jgi:hypothetical protein
MFTLNLNRKSTKNKRNRSKADTPVPGDLPAIRSRLILPLSLRQTFVSDALSPACVFVIVCLNLRSSF